ncbi:hypothetical protein H4R19_001121 [Coemansia spiralis]|nr:hypothetical protein H4R19_001121 [Coemansia spiralis]
MHIDVLPDEILSLIIGRAERPARPTRGLWETARPVLSVCRRWRCVALPIVYRDLNFWCEEGADADSAPGASCVLTTNAGLVASMGVAHLVRSVCMTMFYSVNPAACIEQALSRMQSAAAGRTWAGVRKLDLFIHPVADDVLADSFTTADLARSFAALMPGIVDVCLDDHVSDGFTLSMYRSLVGAYAHQLRRLETSYIWGANAQSLGRPTHLEIRFDQIHCQVMPSVALDGLVSLRLEGVSSYRVWSLLAGSTAQKVVFSSLENLHVLYAPDHFALSDSTASLPALRLEFPRLCNLAIHNAHEYCPVIAAATLPPAMAEVSIGCTAAAFCKFAARVPPQCRAMRLSVDCEDDTDFPRLFSLLCRTLARAQWVLGVRVFAVTDRLVPECELLEWPPFTKITIVQSATRANITTIVRRLPHLVELVVCGLECGPADTHTALPPRRALKILALHFNPSGFTTDGALAFLLHCAQCMPSLELVRVLQLHSARVAQLVRDHAQAHPHLASVQFDCLDRQIAGQGRPLVRMLNSS